MKSKKSALLLSFTSLLLCFAMLAGSTFAWFTDTATTGVNKITSGNLDVEAYYRTSANSAWAEIDEATDLFGTEGTLFEPGHTRVVELKIKNAGNLALKYKIGMNIASETAGTNKFGDPYKLSESLKVANTLILASSTGNETTDAAAAWLEGAIFNENSGSNVWKETRDFANFELVKDSNDVPHNLLPGGEVIFGMKIYMPDTVGNEANAQSTEQAASITFGLNILATQYIYERDSFSNDYDKDATYPEVEAGKLAETLETLADNAVITVNGTVDTALTISKPVTIHNLTATAPVTIASSGVTLNAAKIEYKAAKTPALVVNSGVTDVAITNSVITAETGNGGSHTAVSLPVSGKVVFTGNTVTNDYNGIEFGQGASELLGNGSVIANNTFKNIGNNAISIYRVAEGATVTIENNVFEKVSNAIRLSNYVESTTAIFEIKNNAVDIVNSWEKVFVLLEDVGNNDFTKYTLNFSGNTFNGETVNYYKVYSDAARDFVTNNNPATTGTN